MKTTMFKNDMYKAVLDLRKTQTRRLDGLHEINKNPDEWDFKGIFSDTKQNDYFQFARTSQYLKTINIKPKYQVGDIVGIKENFYIMKLQPTAYHHINFEYNFDREFGHLKLTDKEWSKYKKWKNKTGNKSKLFMFESLIRNKIEITDIRVERVQDISVEDVWREGINWDGIFKNDIERFQGLWDSINKKRGYGWDVNPWVWVREFKRVEK
jgi:hypothetical protein